MVTTFAFYVTNVARDIGGAAGIAFSPDYRPIYPSARLPACHRAPRGGYSREYCRITRRQENPKLSLPNVYSDETGSGRGDYAFRSRSIDGVDARSETTEAAARLSRSHSALITNIRILLLRNGEFIIARRLTFVQIVPRLYALRVRGCVSYINPACAFVFGAAAISG